MFFRFGVNASDFKTKTLSAIPAFTLSYPPVYPIRIKMLYDHSLSIIENTEVYFFIVVRNIIKYDNN